MSGRLLYMLRMSRFAKITFAFALIISLTSVGTSAENTVVKTKKSPLAWSQRPEKRVPAANVKAAVKRFNDSNGKNWKVRYNPLTGSPESMMDGRSSKRYYGKNPNLRARSFLNENSEMLNINTDNLKEAGENSFLGINHVRYQQYYKGLPVEFTYTKVHMEEDGTITGYQSSYDPTIDIDINPSISVAQALQTASSDSGSTIKISSHTLVIFPDTVNGKHYLAWRIRGRSFDGRHLWVYYVNAKNGDILFNYDDMRRVACPSSNVSATSKANVYEISPVPNADFPYGYPSTYWQKTDNPTLSPLPVSLKPLADQYIWIKDYSTRMTTDVNGVAKSTNSVRLVNGAWKKDDTSSCSSGKIFSALKGPYFTVTNMRGQSAHWDNGGGQWQHGNYAEISAMPYPNNASLRWNGSLTPTLNSGNTFAKQYPVFNQPFEVGELSDDGTISNLDEVFVGDRSGNYFGSYIGNRTSQFRGPSIENTDFSVRLVSDASTVGRGFSISGSDYIVLTKEPGVSLAASYNDINWSPASMKTHSAMTSSQTGYGLALLESNLGCNDTFGLDEANAFYHLNKMRSYFMNFNVMDSNLCPKGSPCYKNPVNIDKHINVMVHANGNADKMHEGVSYRNGMENAFFDLELENIMIGDGDYDGNNDSFAYRSFALDGTIVRHEYTHFLVHQIYNIINFGEFGAISEALSDYFALASLWYEGDKNDGYNATIRNTKKGMTKVGNFVMSPRDLSKTDKKMPGSWRGELYNDSQILSQALYSLRKGANSPIGSSNFMPAGSPWGDVPVVDLAVFASLFYYPDSFRGFYEAMADACSRINKKWAGTCNVSKIDTAFGAHGLIHGGSVSDSDPYESVNGDKCQNNNGPECAADITDIRQLSARIYPAGDFDYYTFTANAGTFAAQLILPENDNYNFHGYMMALYDGDRNLLEEKIPLLNASDTANYCFGDDPCYSLQQKVDITFNLPSSGRYYLLVSAPPSWYPDLYAYGISPENSTSEYILKTAFAEQGNVKAEINRSASSFDSDSINFSAPALVSPSFTNDIIDESIIAYSSGTAGRILSVENYFSHVQLWDVLGHKLDQASTKYMPESNRLVKLDGTPYISSSANITGKLKIQEGFSRRYPSVGSVIVEVVGYNRMGNLVSLGKSAPVNLTSNNSSTFEAYNNILLKGQGSALIRFAVKSRGRLTIKAYTQSGKLVKVIADRTVEAGEQGNEKWDGTNDKGAKVASGIYFIKAEGPGLDTVEKVAVVR